MALPMPVENAFAEIVFPHTQKCAFAHCTFSPCVQGHPKTHGHVKVLEPSEIVLRQLLSSTFSATVL